MTKIISTENEIVNSQIEKVVNDQSTPHVKVCSCGHPDYYHLNYNEKCYSDRPDRITDHYRENETFHVCDCKEFDCVIDTNQIPCIIKKGVFSAH